MGLDMYLRAVEYVSPFSDYSSDFGQNPNYEAIISAVAPAWQTEGYSGGIHLEIPVAYWRKVNAIHIYFVKKHGNHIDECQPIYVSREDLTNLRNTCSTVLAIRTQNISEALLPTASGFFFGSTDYDEWYYEGIQQTFDQLNKILDDSNFDSFVYQASW